MHSAGLWNVKLDERFKKLQHILPTNNCTIGHSIRHWLECYKIGKNSTKIPIIWYLATFWAPPPHLRCLCMREFTFEVMVMVTPPPELPVYERTHVWSYGYGHTHPPLRCLCMREFTSEVMVMVTFVEPRLKLQLICHICFDVCRVSRQYFDWLWCHKI